MSRNVTRLYEQFRPENYNLDIKVNKAKLTFAGTVIITGKKVGRPSKRITFHQKELKIRSAVIARHDKKGTQAVSLSRINKHDAYDEVRLHSQNILFPGNYTITLEFSGKITDPMNGLYPSRFSENGKEKIILGTQFESHHAREVFPCIDEPEAKATFDLSLHTPIKETVLANTPIKSQKQQAGLLATVFETTPIMSSYLLAFVIGDISYKEATTKGGVTIRTYAVPAKVAQTEFALNIAVKCLDFYNEYFDIPYPLDKLDMVALPDFASGAMENWGLVTYREQCMLVDPKHTSVQVKQYVAMVIAHELAHQWFGNLVTMRWWTDLWLNEGFASWIEYLATDYLFPEWQMWTQFVAEEKQVALRLDALDNTHPIEVPVRHPDEIRTIFDVISYSKGSSIIHMLHDYLGATDFRDGLRHYLKKHAFGNTDTVDLWEALGKVSGKDVKGFMHAWTTQPGFPILSATIAPKSVELHQERFYLHKPKTPDNALWPIPLLASQQLTSTVLDKNSASLKTNQTNNLLINHGRSGFYRVAYDTDHLSKLAAEVEKNQINPTDRLGLLSDSFEAAKAGYIDTTSPLMLLNSYASEDNAVVWDTVATGLGDVRSVMGENEDVREAMKPFIRKLTKVQLGRLGWKQKSKEPYFDTLLRPTILGLNASADEPSVIKECRKLFAGAKSPEDFAPDVRGVVWGTIARHGGLKEFDTFVGWHNTSTNSEIRTALAGAITGFKDTKLTKKALAMAKTDDVRKQDAAYWVAYAFSNRWGRDVAWLWMQENWTWLEKNLGSDLSFSRFPIYAARVFVGKKYLKEFEAFFKPKISPSLERSIKQGIEMITWHTAWHDRDRKQVLDYLTKSS